MKMFRNSLAELKDLRAVLVTGLFIAISMVIESFTINLGFAKINFAFLAIAAIGMLYGPTVGFCAGALCDIVGYIAYPDGGFLPLYVLIGAAQGLLYGLVAYRGQRFGCFPAKKFAHGIDWGMMLRLGVARLLDVLIINLVCNTAANYHYGFLRDRTLGAAIAARVVKNLLELPIDILLIVVVLPAILEAYGIVFGKREAMI